MRKYDIYPFGDTTSPGLITSGFDITRYAGKDVVKWKQLKNYDSLVYIELGYPAEVIVRYYDHSKFEYVDEKILGLDSHDEPVVEISLKYQLVRDSEYLRLFGDVEPDVVLFSADSEYTLVDAGGGRFAKVKNTSSGIVEPTEEEIDNFVNGRRIDLKNSNTPSYSGIGSKDGRSELINFQQSFVYWNVFTKEYKTRYMTSVYWSSNFTCRFGSMAGGGGGGGSGGAASGVSGSYIDPDGAVGSVVVGGGYSPDPFIERVWRGRFTHGWVQSKYIQKLGKGLYISGSSYSNNSNIWSPTEVWYYVNKEYCGAV